MAARRLPPWHRPAEPRIGDGCLRICQYLITHRLHLASHLSQGAGDGDDGTHPISSSGHTITTIFIVLILALIAVLPTWRQSSKWGFRPSGGIALLLFVLALLYIFQFRNYSQ